MTIQQNTDRIQTTDIGALRHAVIDVMRKQVECGICIVTDGEFSKPGFFRNGLRAFNHDPIKKC